MKSIYQGHRFPPEIISHGVWLYHRFTLSFRDVEDLLASEALAFPKSAQVQAPNFTLEREATQEGADLLLRVTNDSKHDWPELASIIPCFNPGPVEIANQAFLDENHQHTYFLGPKGLTLLQAREIHFNERIRRVLGEVAPDMRFVFSEKWPTSETNATAGILIRESTNGDWVTGIAWDDFLSAQGHNSWKCMHLAVRVGPLRRGEQNIVRGKIYLFPGTKEECLAKFEEDFLIN